jgi:hypothetical protein
MTNINKFNYKCITFIFLIRYGFEDIYYNFWEWWLAMYLGNYSYNVWEGLESECIDNSDTAPWSEYLKLRNIYKDYLILRNKAL